MADDTKDILKNYEHLADAAEDVASQLNKINKEQAEQLQTAKELGIEGELLQKIKERQLSQNQQELLTQENIANKIKRIGELQYKLSQITDKTSKSWMDTNAEIIQANAHLALVKTYYDSIEKSIDHHTHLIDILNKAGYGKTIDAIKETSNLLGHSPMVAVFTVSAYLLKKIVDTFKEMDDAAAAFRRTMGATRGATGEIEATARGIAFDFAHVGVSIKDAYEAFVATAKSIGTTQALTKDMAIDVSLMSAQLGIAAQTSVDFLKTMGMISNSTAASQTNMALFTQRMAEAGGVPLGQVMEDVAGASKSSFSFLSRSPLELAKAAVEARKMGTSLTEATTTAKSLIDFTSNIKAEMEASVLLGQNLNLQRARELAYNKDIIGLNKEILHLAEQVNFNQLDPFQQEAVAKAFGKTSGEISNILQAERERRAIERAAATDPALRAQVERYKTLEKANAAIAKSAAEDSRQLIKIHANQAAIASITNSWKAIVQRVAEVFLPVISVVLQKVAEWMGKLNNSTTSWILALTAAGGGLAIVVALASKLVGVLFGSVGKGIGKAAEGALGGVSKGIASFGTPRVFAGIAAIGLLGVALLPFVAAMKMLTGLEWKSLAIAATGLVLFTAAAFGLGALLATGAGALLFGAGVLGIAALGVALIPLGIAATKAGNGLKMLGDGFTAIVGGLERLQNLSFFGIISQVQSLSSVLTSLSKVISDIPAIDIEKIQKLGSVSFTSPTATQQTTVTPIEAAGKTLTDVYNMLDTIRREFESGVIAANVNLDGQKLESSISRTNKLRGALGAGVRQ